MGGQLWIGFKIRSDCRVIYNLNQKFQNVYRDQFVLSLIFDENLEMSESQSPYPIWELHVPPYFRMVAKSSTCIQTSVAPGLKIRLAKHHMSNRGGKRVFCGVLQNLMQETKLNAHSFIHMDLNLGVVNVPCNFLLNVQVL